MLGTAITDPISVLVAVYNCHDIFCLQWYTTIYHKFIDTDIVTQVSSILIDSGLPSQRATIPKVHYCKGVILRNAYLTLSLSLTLTLIPGELLSDLFAMADLCGGVTGIAQH